MNYLGDSGYALKDWLMTPFAAPIKNHQRGFNRALDSQERL